MWCKYIVFVSLITADLLFPASCSSEQGVKIFEADLTSGSSKITKASNAKVCYMRTLGTNRGSEKCNLQGVIRITFPPSINGKHCDQCHYTACSTSTLICIAMKCVLAIVT